MITALYLEFEIQWHKDIKESSFNQEDKRWKQGQIDLLQRMVDEIDTPSTEKCNCHTCRPISFTDPLSVFMRLCPTCGNKRCPKATNHTNECTNSNDPNQEGSIY